MPCVVVKIQVSVEDSPGEQDVPAAEADVPAAQRMKTLEVCFLCKISEALCSLD